MSLIYQSVRGDNIVNDFDLQKFIKDFQEYVDNKIKNETPEESKQALIRAGIMDEEGNIILRHGEEW
jgi:hypothetical protein